MGKKTKAICSVDIECYSNYFYALFKGFGGKSRYELRLYNDRLQMGTRRGVEEILDSQRIVTFNGNAYD